MSAYAKNSKNSLRKEPLFTQKTHRNLFHEATKGFAASIIAIGILRAWLSSLTGAYPIYGITLADTDALRAIQRVFFILFFILFSCVKVEGTLKKHRAFLSLFAGCLGAIFLAFDHYCIPAASWGSIPAICMLSLVFAWMLRLWGEDNCSSDFRLILIRLGLSFIVQYIVYTCVYVLPEVARPLCALSLPLLLGFVLRKSPHSSSFGEVLEKDLVPPYKIPPSKSIPLIFMVALFCAGHGLLFLSLNEMMGTWVLGSLIVALIVLFFVFTLHDELIFKSVICATLFIQCLSALLVFIFPFSTDLISLAKSLSYAITMLLALSIGCRLGASDDRYRGRFVCALMAVYFISFYTAWYIGRSSNLDSFVSILLIIIFLVFAALLMIINDWSAVFAQEDTEEILTKLSENQIAILQEKLTSSAGLTPRESEVLASLLHDLPVKKIASESHLSTNTVRTQIQAIYKKLDIHSRDELKTLVKQIL